MLVGMLARRAMSTYWCEWDENYGNLVNENECNL